MAKSQKKRNTWRKDLEQEMRTAGFRYSWKKAEAVAQERAGWRQVVCGICSTWNDKAQVKSSQRFTTINKTVSGT